MIYNTEYDVKYSDNFQYRLCLRNVFQMNIEKNMPKFEDMEDLDEETMDELLYDANAMDIGMTYILEKTKNQSEFHELYEIGAARMFSTNTDIGLAVLLSYDYFELFHLCFHDFLQCPEQFNHENANYKKLKNKIS